MIEWRKWRRLCDNREGEQASTNTVFGFVVESETTCEQAQPRISRISQVVEIAAGHGLHPCEDQEVSVKDEPRVDVRLKLASAICAGNHTKYAKGVQGARGENPSMDLEVCILVNNFWRCFDSSLVKLASIRRCNWPGLSWKDAPTTRKGPKPSLCNGHY